MIQIPICRIAAVLYTSLRHFDRGRFSMLRINQNGNWERILGRWQAIFPQEFWRISKKNCTVQRAKGPPVGYVDIFQTSPGQRHEMVPDYQQLSGIAGPSSSVRRPGGGAGRRMPVQGEIPSAENLLGKAVAIRIAVYIIHHSTAGVPEARLCYTLRLRRVFQP